MPTYLCFSIERSRDTPSSSGRPCIRCYLWMVKTQKLHGGFWGHYEELEFKQGIVYRYSLNVEVVLFLTGHVCGFVLFLFCCCWGSGNRKWHWGWKVPAAGVSHLGEMMERNDWREMISRLCLTLQLLILSSSYCLTSSASLFLSLLSIPASWRFTL